MKKQKQSIFNNNTKAVIFVFSIMLILYILIEGVFSYISQQKNQEKIQVFRTNSHTGKKVSLQHANSNGTMYGINPQRTNVSLEKGITTFHGLKWKLSLPKPKSGNKEITDVNYTKISSFPLIANGVIYFCTGDGTLHAINLDNQKELWKYESCSYYTPAIANGAIFTGNVALNIIDGTVLWKFQSHGVPDEGLFGPYTRYGAISSPVVVNGNVYIGVQDEGIYALDATTGKQIWYTKGPTNSPAIDNGVIYDTNDLDYVYALDISTGKLLWKQQTDNEEGGMIYTHPIISNNTVFIATDFGYIYAFDAKTGQRKWKYSPPCEENKYCVPDFSNPAVDNTTVYSFYTTPPHTSFAIALDIQTGKVKWQNQIGKNLWHPPVVNNKIVYYSTFNQEVQEGNGCGHEGCIEAVQIPNYLYALDTATGKMKWQFYIPSEPHQLGDAIENSPAIYDDTIYLGTLNGDLFAIH